jgi:hypothetical protein
MIGAPRRREFAGRAWFGSAACGAARAKRHIRIAPSKGVIMAGRGPQSFKKRQKEQARKEKQQEKIAKRLERKQNPQAPSTEEYEPFENLDYLDREPVETSEGEPH